MRFSCKIFGHKWNGCKCEHCGETRDEQHDWDGCKCSRCGKARDKQHNYVLALSNDGFCEEVCTQCGKKKRNKHISNGKNCSKCPICGRAIGGEVHDWDGDKCRRCGINRKELEEALNKAWEMANGTGRTGW
ncbi:MAG: hypothetical protein LBG12_02300 [Synergistaceae bacterium]|nr:hypothetical protein [Synergistaceae bacterium]